MDTDPRHNPTAPLAASQTTRPSAGQTAAGPAAGLPAQAPTMIGEYAIIRLIGEGGMGAVYEAEQPAPHRTVALKVIRPGLATPALLRRFEAEAEILGRLQHPGIAQIYEAGTADTGAGPQPYFAMELVHGEASGEGGGNAPTLSEYVRAKKLGTRQKLGLLALLADAVQYAHQKGIIHRDLKPGNVLVDAMGQPKILDFGVARVTDADVQTTMLQTDVGTLVGTLAYMSPEQAAGDPNELDTRSDVYALGVIAYELLVGKPPYEVARKMVHEAVRVIQQEEPTKLSRIDRALRGDVETIIAKALEKDRNLRYQSAHDFGADIRRYLADEPIIARPPTTFYQLRKFARRHRALTVSILLITAILILGIMGTSAGMARATIQRNRAEAAEAQQRVELARTYVAAAELARQRGNYPAVLENLDKALAIGADEADVRLRRARALIDLTHMPDAAVELDRVQRLPHSASLDAQWNLLQGRLTRVTDASRSIPYFQAALKGPLPPADEHYIKAQFALKAVDAVREYQLSLDADPYGRAPATELSMVQVFTGPTDRALARLDAMVLLYPDDRELRGARLLAEFASGGHAAFDADLAAQSSMLQPEDMRVIRLLTHAIDSVRSGLEDEDDSGMSVIGILTSAFGAVDEMTQRASTRPGQSVQALQFPPLFKRFVDSQIRANLVGLFASPEKTQAMLSESIDILPLPYLILMRASLRVEARQYDDAEKDLDLIDAAGPSLLDARPTAASLRLSLYIDRHLPFEDEEARKEVCRHLLEMINTYRREHARLLPSMVHLGIRAAQELEDWSTANTLAGYLANMRTKPDQTLLTDRINTATGSGAAGELAQLANQISNGNGQTALRSRITTALLHGGGTAMWQGVYYADNLLFDISDSMPLISANPQPTPPRAFGEHAESGVSSVDVSGDGQFILLAQQGHLRIVHLSDWKESKSIAVTGTTHQACFALDGRVIVESAEVNQIPQVRVWGVRSGELLATFYVPADRITLEADGQTLNTFDSQHRSVISLRLLRIERMEKGTGSTTKPTADCTSPTGDARFFIAENGHLLIERRAAAQTQPEDPDP